MEKRGFDFAEVDAVIKLLIKDDSPLPEKYLDHALLGGLKGYRECHIKPDWLLVYRKDKEELILVLITTGTHSDIF